VVELEDLDRLLAISAPEEASAALEAFDGALRATAGDKGEVLTEGGRAFVIAPGLSRARAWGLGARLTSAVAGAHRWRGAPLKVSVGLAVLGQNGDDPATLIAAAEESRFAAQASGTGPGG
jgi:GGDEF domain-containing protein